MGGEVLVLGIVGMLTWLIPFFGLPIPLIGLVWGIIILRRKPARKWLVTSGVVLCSLGLSLSIFYSVISAINPPSTVNTGPPPDIDLTVQEIPEPGSVAWVADGVITDGEYFNTEQLGNNYTLYWNNDSEYIYIGMQATTTGWVALGIQLDLRSNKDIDMILGYVRGNEVTVYDLFSIEVGTDHPGLYPRDRALGGSEDVTAFGGVEGAGGTPDEEDEEIIYTVIEFKRKLNTGDQYDQPLFEGANTIVWSYGPDDLRDSPYVEQGYWVIEIR